MVFLLSKRKILSLLISVLVLGFCLDLCCGSGFCTSPANEDDLGHHHCDHGHDHHDHVHKNDEKKRMLLPEELAEEEDMKLYGFGPYHDDDHDHDHHKHHHSGDSELSGLGLWLRALGCSLLVSLASLICLILLPVIFLQGKPSRGLVDVLALFGAGAMLGDAFLHQLPHAFGGEHSHSHDHTADHGHHVHTGRGHQQSHVHSLKDLSVGLSVLAGIVLFLLVEKLVRYVEEYSGQANSWGHGHHHQVHSKSKKSKDDSDVDEKTQSQSSCGTEGKVSDGVTKEASNGDNLIPRETLPRKRKTTPGAKDDKSDVNTSDGSVSDITSLQKEKHAHSASSLVFGYLNLFSDGVHNFTDGMALGSAFLLYGSLGGWSRTLFLLAHEIPQEVGDFGILVRSGFSVTKALFFNFLSALVALAGTALALLWGQDPGQSSLIEGFTAGGFIYIAVAGVLAEMNNNGSSTLKSTAVQLVALMLGMSVALFISLIE